MISGVCRTWCQFTAGLDMTQIMESYCRPSQRSRSQMWRSEVTRKVMIASEVWPLLGTQESPRVLLVIEILEWCVTAICYWPYSFPWVHIMYLGKYARNGQESSWCVCAYSPFLYHYGIFTTCWFSKHDGFNIPSYSHGNPANMMKSIRNGPWLV